MNLYLSSLSGLTFFKGCRIVQRRLERWFDPKQQTQAHSISDFSCFVFSSFLKSTTFKLNIHTNNHFICIYEFHLNYINWVASWTWNRRYNNLNSANCSEGRNTIKIIIPVTSECFCHFQQDSNSSKSGTLNHLFPESC